MEEKNKTNLPDHVVTDEEMNDVSGGWEMGGTRTCGGCGYSENFTCDSSKWNWLVMMEIPSMRCPNCKRNMFKVTRRY